MAITTVNKEEDIKTEFYLARCGVITNTMFIPLQEPECVLGREILNSAHISRRHASFQQTGNGGWFIKDLKSLNGLFKNGKRLKSQCLHNIEVGEHISFGVPSCKSESDFEFILCQKENFEDSKRNIPLVKAENNSGDNIIQVSSQLQKAEETVLIKNIEKRPSILPQEVFKNEVKPKVKNETENSVSVPSLSNTTVGVKKEVNILQEKESPAVHTVKQEPGPSQPKETFTSPKMMRFSKLSRKRNISKPKDPEIILLDSSKKTDTELDDDITIIDLDEENTPCKKSRYFQTPPVIKSVANNLTRETFQHTIDLEAISSPNQTVQNGILTNKPLGSNMVQLKLNFVSRPELGIRNALTLTKSQLLVATDTTISAKKLIDGESVVKIGNHISSECSNAQTKYVNSNLTTSKEGNLDQNKVDDRSIAQTKDDDTSIDERNLAQIIKMGTGEDVGNELVKRTCDFVTEKGIEEYAHKPSVIDVIKVPEAQLKNKLSPTKTNIGPKSMTKSKEFVSPDSTTVTHSNNTFNFEVNSTGFNKSIHSAHNKTLQSDMELPTSTTDSEDDIVKINKFLQNSEVEEKLDEMEFDKQHKDILKQRKLQDKLVKEAQNKNVFVLLTRLPEKMIQNFGTAPVRRNCFPKVKGGRARIISSSESEDEPENSFPSTSKEEATIQQDIFEKITAAHDDDDDEMDHLNYSQVDDCIILSDSEDTNVGAPSALLTPKIELIDEVCDTNENGIPSINEQSKCDENDFFPILSQAFYEDNDLVDTDPTLEKPSTSAKGKKTSIQLTEPLALKAKPKRMCGRGEWIKPRQKHDIETNQFYAKKKSTGLKLTTTNEIKKKTKKKTDLKAKLQADMGHRIPCPGGGSAIRPDGGPIIRHEAPIARPKIAPVTAAKILNPTSTEVTASKRKLSEDSSPKENANFIENITSMKTKTAKVTTCSRMDKMIETPDPKLLPKKTLSGFKIPKKPAPTVKSVTPSIASKPPSTVASRPNLAISKENFNSAIKSASSQNTTNKFNYVNPPPMLNVPLKETYVKKSNTTVPHYQKLNTRKIRFSDESNLEDKQPVPKSLVNGASFKESAHHPVVNSNQVMLKKSNLKASVMPVKQGSRVNVVPTHKYTAEKFLAVILKWNVKWLEEQTKSSEPPPLIKSTKMYKPVKTHYASVDDHFETYFPLLILETWEVIFRKWNDNRLTSSDYEPAFVATDYSSTNIINANNDIFGVGTVQTIIEYHKLSNLSLFKEGTLIIFEQKISVNDSPGEMKFANFGYINEMQKVPFDPRTNQNAMLSTFAAARSKKPYLITLFIKMRYQSNVKPKWDKFLKIKPITYIRPAIRQVDSLISLDKSTLAKYILTPQTSGMQAKFYPQNKLVALGNFNKSQSNAILGAAYLGLMAENIPKIVLLQGPPGTGKTHTCIGLIQQLLYGQGSERDVEVSRRLLVLAPSNAAIDEITRRLIKLKTKLEATYPNRKLSFVRVGQPDCMNPDIKDYSIDQLAKRNCVEKEKKQDNELSEQINIIEAKINALNEKMDHKLQINQDVQKELQEVNICHCEIKKLESRRKQLSNNVVDFAKNDDLTKKLLMNHKKQIIMKYDIILTTLSSSRQSLIDNIFGPNSKSIPLKFTACIVDEASQCCEPELLLPLQYRISKLILIGDPRQLPATILSQKAASFNFQKSLFERFHNYFENSESPIIMLNEQYRMHSAICSFPSQYFYNNALYTSPDVDKQLVSFPLKPYIMLDLEDGKETSNQFGANSFQNSKEVSIILKVCEEIIKLIPTTCTIGVITPYQGQRKLFMKSFGQLIRRIEINTVDGFQGREKDIIIMSCVRANDDQVIGFLKCPQRLNVAITRACKCTIICGHLDSLSKHQHWNSLIKDGYSRNVVQKVNSTDNISKIMRFIRR